MESIEHICYHPVLVPRAVITNQLKNSFPPNLDIANNYLFNGAVWAATAKLCQFTYSQNITYHLRYSSRSNGVGVWKYGIKPGFEVYQVHDFELINFLVFHCFTCKMGIIVVRWFKGAKKNRRPCFILKRAYE